nr:hypothetical protein K4M19_00453 [Agrobacterium fabrum]
MQRAMTAMALCAKPDLIVFDEPTTALDVETQREVLGAIRKAIALESTAAIYISHDLPLVAQIADSVHVLRRGRSIEEGPVTTLIRNPADPYTEALLSAGTLSFAAPPETSEPVLEMRSVTAGYDRNRPVVNDVSLSVCRGRNACARREIGIREVDARSDRKRAAPSNLRPDLVRRKTPRRLYP